MKNQPGFMKKQPWTSKTNLEPWKSKTNLNPWKSVITDMEPWKTNLQPSKLTRSCTGWLWVVQVVTGDSQEEEIIFRYTQTDTASYIYHHHHLCASRSVKQSIAGSPMQELRLRCNRLGQNRCNTLGSKLEQYTISDKFCREKQMGRRCNTLDLESVR